MLLKPGDAHELGPYTVRYDRLSQNTDSQKQMITAHMTVLEDGEVLGEMYPARWFFFKHEDRADDRGGDAADRSPTTSTSCSRATS